MTNPDKDLTKVDGKTAPPIYVRLSDSEYDKLTRVAGLLSERRRARVGLATVLRECAMGPVEELLSNEPESEKPAA